MPLHLLASVCLLTLYSSATFVYKSCSPLPYASIALTASSINFILVKLLYVKVSDTLVF
jgi:hypothetical protein